MFNNFEELEESIKNKVIVTKESNGTKLRVEHSL